MDKEAVLEGNKLIAEYMGATVEQGYSKNKEQDGRIVTYPKELAPDMYCTHSLSTLKYHSSWDWLMPVCIKLGWNEVDIDIEHIHSLVASHPLITKSK